MQDLIKAAANVRLLVLDVDGILSNGYIIYDANGTEIKCFNVKDGMGVKSLKFAGVKTAIITGRSSEMVNIRAQEMGIDYVVQGRDDKLTALKQLLLDLPYELEQCAYMGDDLPDLKALQSVGLSVTVPNAHQEVLSRVMMVTTKAGGEGAVREVCDLILKGHGKYDEYLSQYVID
ncbi:KdsC family phosphatase [Psychrobacter sp. FDAARGOS_221]|uniref:KdsC family phosphatase n=1 Tax=Psychrobacter sp. FDAARGOS_221 TaxID=1975705 RepID=UPI000BB53980|nr:HAD hydrolase family protein [Psychrobacter sp. FDAARGOS_221]PNK61590.1 HAD family hydrolase [Psychrobacter sp. FDAARGOS_221]